MWTARDFYFDLVAQVRMQHWTKGRLALLGDAGYSPSPVTGLGTSLSLVGAYVLAGELARSNGAHDMAFVRYESVMRDYVKQCQELPPLGLEGMLPRTRRAMWMRNASMRMMTRWPVRDLVAGIFHKADAIVLEDYSRMLPLRVPISTDAYAPAQFNDTLISITGVPYLARPGQVPELARMNAGSTHAVIASAAAPSRLSRTCGTADQARPMGAEHHVDPVGGRVGGI